MVCCSTIHQVPVQTQIQTQTILKDSTIVHIDTVTYQLPVESSVAFNVQHSHLETTVAYSEASVDSLGMLQHTLTNKPFKIEKQIVYQDRIVTQYRDSTITKEVPVTVEVVKKVVPNWCWYLLAFNILILVFIIIKVYLHFKLQ
jgi:hypothetical protein